MTPSPTYSRYMRIVQSDLNDLSFDEIGCLIRQLHSAMDRHDQRCLGVLKELSETAHEDKAWLFVNCVFAVLMTELETRKAAGVTK